MNYDLKRIRVQEERERKVRQNTIIIFSAALCLIAFIVFLVIYFSSAKSTPAKTNPGSIEVQNEPEPPASESSAASNVSAQITVSMMGDCTFGMDESFGWDTSFNAYFEYRGADYFLQNVKSILDADDLSIVNFEGTLTDSTQRQEKLFAFKGAPAFASILSAGSIEAANMANNHSHDYGDQSYEDTLGHLKNEKITTFGYDETAIMEIKGVKVGLVGIYEMSDHLGRSQQLRDNIDKVKSEGAQLIIVSFHWGNEKETLPDSNQVTLGHMAIDYGADLVVGHHPHVLQGIEKYQGKYIAYSLGNFCFGGNTAPDDMDTIIFQQTFTIEDGKVLTDDNTNIIPCSISSEYGYNNYQPTPAAGDEARRIMDKLNERSDLLP